MSAFENLSDVCVTFVSQVGHDRHISERSRDEEGKD